MRKMLLVVVQLLNLRRHTLAEEVVIMIWVVVVVGLAVSPVVFVVVVYAIVGRYGFLGMRTKKSCS